MANTDSKKEIPNQMFWEVEFKKMLDHLKKNGIRIAEVTERRDNIVAVIFMAMYTILSYGAMPQLQTLSYIMSLMTSEIMMIEESKKKKESKIIIPDQKIDLGNLKIH